MLPGCVGLRSLAGEKLCRVYKAICGWKAYPGWGCQGRRDLLQNKPSIDWAPHCTHIPTPVPLVIHPCLCPQAPMLYFGPLAATRECKLFTGAETRFTNTTGSGLMEWRVAMEWVSLFLQCGVNKQMQQREKQIKSLNLATICLCTSGCLSDKQFLNQ